MPRLLGGIKQRIERTGRYMKEAFSGFRKESEGRGMLDVLDRLGKQIIAQDREDWNSAVLALRSAIIEGGKEVSHHVVEIPSRREWGGPLGGVVPFGVEGVMEMTERGLIDFDALITQIFLSPRHPLGEFFKGREVGGAKVSLWGAVVREFSGGGEHGSQNSLRIWVFGGPQGEKLATWHCLEAGLGEIPLFGADGIVGKVSGTILTFSYLMRDWRTYGSYFQAVERAVQARRPFRFVMIVDEGDRWGVIQVIKVPVSMRPIAVQAGPINKVTDRDILTSLARAILSI